MKLIIVLLFSLFSITLKDEINRSLKKNKALRIALNAISCLVLFRIDNSFRVIDLLHIMQKEGVDDFTSLLIIEELIKYCIISKSVEGYYLVNKFYFRM